MLLSQIEFLLLLSCVMAVVCAVRSHAVQKWILLIASYYFYAYWDWRFAGLMFLCTLINWYAAIRVARPGASSRGRRAWFIFSVVSCLCILGYFKYVNFFIDSWNALFGGWLSVLPVSVILPVGISFFTFQTMSYTIDVYRGDLQHVRSLRDLSLFVAFFPQLVAGPIVRAQEFLPQLQAPRILTGERLRHGLQQYASGFFKKIFIADRLAQYVDGCFSNAGVLDGASLWMGTLAYAAQIYCDFSGYSDMAIGLARAMGYDFSENFRHPYLAANIQDFWRRWHISLSTWLRDYLYISLGGNRRGHIRTYANLLLTMLLGGLWHGANWTFVAWGGLHGMALAAHKIFRELRRPSGDRSPPSRAGRVLAWGSTMLVVLIGWVLFRAQSFSAAFLMLSRMFSGADGLRWIHPGAAGAFALFLLGHVSAGIARLRPLRTVDVRTVYGAAAVLVLLLAAIIWKPEGFQPFIYFQF
jgi:alginate O-acetyltransferase complex protein AlgI